jgi:uncharacterized membrane protein
MFYRYPTVAALGALVAVVALVQGEWLLVVVCVVGVAVALAVTRHSMRVSAERRAGEPDPWGILWRRK